MYMNHNNAAWVYRSMLKPTILINIFKSVSRSVKMLFPAFYDRWSFFDTGRWQHHRSSFICSRFPCINPSPHGYPLHHQHSSEHNLSQLYSIPYRIATSRHMRCLITDNHTEIHYIRVRPGGCTGDLVTSQMRKLYVTLTYSP